MMFENFQIHERSIVDSDINSLAT